MRTALLAVLSLTLVACGHGSGSPAGASSAPGSGDDAVVSTQPPSGPVTGAPVAERVTPQPGTRDPRPVPWQDADGHGRTVTVSWVSGVPPCTVLDRVEVAETPELVTITLVEGADPQARNVACIEIAQYKETVVRLDAPLGRRRIVDGAAR